LIDQEEYNKAHWSQSKPLSKYPSIGLVAENSIGMITNRSRLSVPESVYTAKSPINTDLKKVNSKKSIRLVPPVMNIISSTAKRLQTKSFNRSDTHKETMANNTIFASNQLKPNYGFLNIEERNRLSKIPKTKRRVLMDA